MSSNHTHQTGNDRSVNNQDQQRNPPIGGFQDTDLKTPKNDTQQPNYLNQKKKTDKTGK